MLKRLFTAIPSRYRPWIKALVIAFLIFEAWRLWLIGGDILGPLWTEQLLPRIEAQAHFPFWIAATGFIVALLAFVIPMAGVLYLFWRVVWKGRRPGRNGTAD